MTNLKAGDKVKNKKTGEILTVKSVAGDKEYDRFNFCWADGGFLSEENSLWNHKKKWEKIEQRSEITFENCEVGDWLETKEGKKKKVLKTVTEKRLILSLSNDETEPDEGFAGWAEHGDENLYGIVDAGFKFVQPAQAVEEMTVEQVCKALGKKIKIVK
jgi:hypothetical protein